MESRVHHNMYARFANAASAIGVALILACATGGGIMLVPRSEQDVAKLMGVNDRLIVPGERIGPIFLGMTEEQLYKKMGDPSETHQGTGVLNGVAIITYRWGDLVAIVQPSAHRVVQVMVDGTRYSTMEGVAVGTSVLEMRAKLGRPAWEPDSPDGSLYGYVFDSGGLRVWVRKGGHVSWIDVNASGR